LRLLLRVCLRVCTTVPMAPSEKRGRDIAQTIQPLLDCAMSRPLFSRAERQEGAEDMEFCVGAPQNGAVSRGK